jgi:hypothetical protein
MAWITSQLPMPELASAIQELARQGKSPLVKLDGCVPQCLEVLEMDDLPLPGTYYWKLELPYPGNPTWLVCRPNLREKSKQRR